MNKFILGLLVFTLFGLVILFVWGKPMLDLVTTTHQIRSALTLVDKLAQEPKHYQECQVKTKNDIFANRRYPLSAYQLRFTSPTSFVVEAVCSGASRPTVEVKSEELSNGSRVVSGTGVEVPIKTRPENAQFVVAINKSQVLYGFKNGEVWDDDSGSSTQEIVGLQPQTTCQGVGKVCCDAQKQVGSGSSTSQVSDCPANCFDSCMNRPVVTLFNSDPPASSLERIVTLSKANSAIRVSYRIDDPDNTIASVSLDWGDGKSEESSQAKNSLSHSYRCLQQECDYQITLSAQDTTGLDLLDARLNSLRVRVE